MKLFLASIAILCTVTLSAQVRSDVKIYGYIQPVVGGASPNEAPNEAGLQTSGDGGGRKNYFIYITGPKGQRIYPLEIWIEGQQYSTRTTAVTTTPVVMSIQTGETNPKKVTLVPKTSQAVYQIIPSSGTPTKVLEAARKKAADNDVVISYRLAGKMYYAVLKKMTVLETAALQ